MMDDDFDPAYAHPRVLAAPILFRAAMPLFSKALSAAGKPPPQAAEKEQLFARLEEGAFELPDEAFAGWEDGEEWEERFPTLAPVRALLDAAVAERLEARTA